MLHLITTLLARPGGLNPDDVAALERVRAQVEPDWRMNVRRFELLEARESGALSQAEQHELDQLEQAAELIPWEETLERLERSVANWCLANRTLEDLGGQPTKVQSFRRTLDDPPWPCSRVEHLFAGPPPPEKCPLCGGRGFIQPDDPKKFPARCTHPSHTAT